MKLVAVMWDAYIPLLKRAADEAGIELYAYANRITEEKRELLEEILAKSADADVILFNRTTHSFWEELCVSFQEIREKKPVICVGNDTSYWGLTSTDKEIAIEAYKYLTKNSYENFRRLIFLLDHHFGDKKFEVLPPLEVPFQGIVHPKAGDIIFDSLSDYLEWYEGYIADSGKDDGGIGDRGVKDGGKYVGVIISRAAWLSQNREIEETVIRDLEDSGLRTIPVFTNSVHDDSQKSLNIAEVIQKYFFLNNVSKVSAIVKMTTFMIGKDSSVSDKDQLNTGVSLLKSMNIPVFQPIISYYATIEDWKNSPGLTSDLAWSVAMPEFEGLIEPIMLGASRENRNNEYDRTVIPGHSKKIADRVINWIKLSEKSNAEKKVVFILNNNPCASVEANIGSAAHLDAARSVVNILASMKNAGYNVEVPASAKELMDLFLEKKAISEFRWTTKLEIVRCGGALYQMSTEEYMKFFSSLKEPVQKRVKDIWGEPPGEGMVLDG
ncbi:MAG: cobaltochelatase subunit CobN, partial [Methanomicrobium sp.]|nr:cobaltochelatase subunit CobN [Methanomicrobium sp.]